jgi:uncharacterized protein (TIGR03435 family)
MSYQINGGTEARPAGWLAAGRATRLPWFGLALVIASGLAYAQPAPREFDAVSIKSVAAGAVMQCGANPCSNLPPVIVSPTRFRAITEVSGPMGLIEWAYGVREFQVVGVPEMFAQKKFDVEAVAETAASEAQMKEMVRGMLEDRFHLRLRHESRQVPVYSLVFKKISSELKPAKDASINGGRGAIEVRPGRLFGRSTTTDMLAMVLTDNLERPVLNKTGLDGHYDFDLTFEPPPSNGHEFTLVGASIFAPIQELGLKLESSAEVVVLLVIDQLEWPSAN